MKQIELLAPAGSYECMVAALKAGCDAVYIGGDLFGARAYAKNLDEEMMKRAIDYVHMHEKKLYLTVNTLIKNQELEELLYQYIYKFYEHGVDAVIVQDVGVIQFLTAQFPNLDLHASTQMNILMAEGVKLLKSYRVKRLVPGRELCLTELKRMRESTNLEIETFVHGALCYSYSGQCLMSSMIGGRSGNRGRCAQPCRKAYHLLEDGKNRDSKNLYYLSPKDICTLELLPDFIEAGIDSFKIEGRMKRPEYVAGVVAAYRKQIDMYFEYGKEQFRSFRKKQTIAIKEDENELKDLYNRGGFCQGYYYQNNGNEMMSFDRPNHNGVLVGRLEKKNGTCLQLRFIETIHTGDVLELRNSFGDLYEFVIKNPIKVDGQSSIVLKNRTNFEIGSLVFRTKNEHLLQKLTNQYINEPLKRMVRGILTAEPGNELSFFVETLDQRYQVICKGSIVSEAEKQPAKEEMIKEHLMKTGDSPFMFYDLEIKLNGSCFLPVGWLKQIRREALLELETKILSASRRKLKYCEYSKLVQREFSLQAAKISALICRAEQLDAVCGCDEVSEVICELDFIPLNKIQDYAEKITKKGKRCYLALPRICRASTYDLLQKQSEDLAVTEVFGYLVRNLEELYFLRIENKELFQLKKIILDYNMYTINLEAKAFWYKFQVDILTLPVELNQKELAELGGAGMDLIVYGRLPLMVSAQCIAKNVGLCRKMQHNALIGALSLKDQSGYCFPLEEHCLYCYSTLYNSVPLQLFDLQNEIKRLGIRNVRLDFTTEGAKEVGQVLQDCVASYFRQGGKAPIERSNYTRGHMKRGVL